MDLELNAIISNVNNLVRYNYKKYNAKENNVFKYKEFDCKIQSCVNVTE